MLQIRYHPAFKSADTLLFAGSQDDIARLRHFFLNWKGEEIDLIEILQAQEKLYVFSVTELHLGSAAKGSIFKWRDDKGTWLISKEYLEQMIGLLDGLLESSKPGHQYFDVSGSPVQIMIAKDEYPLPQPN